MPHAAQAQVAQAHVALATELSMQKAQLEAAVEGLKSKNSENSELDRRLSEAKRLRKAAEKKLLLQAEAHDRGSARLKKQLAANEQLTANEVQRVLALKDADIEQLRESLKLAETEVQALQAAGEYSHGRVCHYVPIATERAEMYMRS